MGIKLGFEAKLYRQNSTAWDEITNCRDLGLNISAEEADVTTRANAGWKATIGSLKNAEIEFEMIYDSTDTDQTALRNAFLNRTALQMLVMDGAYDAAAAASQGLQAYFAVTKFEVPQNLADAIVVKVAIKPTYAAVAPAWVSSPVTAPT
jgi:hypothetical protein